MPSLLDAKLAGLLLEHLLLTGLPAALAAALAMRRGLRSVPLLLAVALAASGLAAILVFWAYYANPLIGQVAAFLLAFGSLQGIFLCRPDRLDRDLLRELAVPAALWALASAFVAYLGFVHGGGADPLALATTRFSHPLPTDNDIPRFFADWFYDHGHVGTPPPFGDWLSSDRPPLQSGYALAQRPFGWDEGGLHYQVLGIVVQQLWIVGMWAVLYAARLRPLARGLAISAALVSDVGIVHGFFVWPKLIAAAFVLAALALVLSEEWPRLRRSPYAAALFAALCGLAMLAHGASAFGILPLLAIAAWRGLPSWRWLATAALVGVALLAPWTAYQRLADPPGDRLVKWQLGGSLAIDDRGAPEAIVDGYEEAGLGGSLDNKWRNVRAMVGWGDTERAVRSAIDELGEGHPGEAATALRLPRFFALFSFLGILLLGLLAMPAGRVRGSPGGPEWSFALVSLAFCGLGAAIWGLLMFGGPDSTAILHVGSLAVPLLAVCACVVGAYAVSRRLAIVLAGLNSLLVLALYAPELTPVPGTSYSLSAALLAVVALAGFALVALRGRVG